MENGDVDGNTTLDSRDQPRILNMKISHRIDTHIYETALAVLTGTSPLKQQRQVLGLYIYEFLYKNATDIKLVQKLKIDDLPKDLRDISTQFEF